MKINLNRSDIRELLKTLEKFDIDSFELIKHDESGIGYTLDIEYAYRLESQLVTVRMPVVGVDSW